MAINAPPVSICSVNMMLSYNDRNSNGFKSVEILLYNCTLIRLCYRRNLNGLVFIFFSVKMACVMIT